MILQVVAILALFVGFGIVIVITHVYRKRRLPCKPDAADLERRRRIRAGFGGDQGSDQV